MSEPLLTPPEAAAYLKLTVQTLARWRMGRPANGPPYCKLGRGVVRYRPEDLDAWVLARQQPAPPAEAQVPPAEASQAHVIALRPPPARVRP